jgi:hypothetical protein
MSQLTVSRLSKQYRILNISQPNRPQRLLRGLMAKLSQYSVQVADWTVEESMVNSLRGQDTVIIFAEHKPSVRVT